jgi:hypothetical protein
MAHNLLLRVLDSQNTHFKLGLDEALQANVADFQKAYAAAPSTTPAPPFPLPTPPPPVA